MNIDEFLESQTPAEPVAKSEAQQEIIKKVTDIKELLVQRKFEEANASFNALRNDFNEMVKKQDEERAFVQSEMQKISEELMQRLDKMSDEIGKRAEIVMRLLTKANGQLDAGDFVAANQSYATMRDVLSGMPEGFAERKSQLEAEILQFYIRFKEKYTSSQKLKFDGLISHLGMQLDQVERLVREARRPEAAEALEKVKLAFERLPPGFLYEKTGLHQRLLDVAASLSRPPPAFSAPSLRMAEPAEKEAISSFIPPSVSSVSKQEHRFPEIKEEKKKGFMGLFGR